MPVVLTDSEYKSLLKRASPANKKKALSKAVPIVVDDPPSKRLAKCPPGKKRNPKTNRCKKISVSRKRSPVNVSGDSLELARDKVLNRRKAIIDRIATVESDQPKRPLNVYQQFMKDNIALLKIAHPNDSAKFRFSTAVQLWRDHKKANQNQKRIENELAIDYLV